MTNGPTPKYSTKIIKAGALLTDTKALLAHWDALRPVQENLDRLRHENVFGKASRSRVEDILVIFRQRYLADEHVARSLATLVKEQLPAEALDRILYFFAARSDPLLYDTVTETLTELQARGRTDVTVAYLQEVLLRYVTEGRTTKPWSAPTARRVAHGLVATLRDFGVLQGAVNKRLAPFYLPVTAFAYIAFVLKQEQPSGEKLVGHPEWRLFFLSRQAVERSFMEAHQQRLLEYYAAGSVIRVTFPTDSLEEYAHVIAQRPL